MRTTLGLVAAAAPAAGTLGLPTPSASATSGAKTIGGTAHNSPTCNGSTVSGIGRDAAQKIRLRAPDVYMTSGTTYAPARTATLNATTDLYGAASAQRSAVVAAWSAVSVS